MQHEHLVRILGLYWGKPNGVLCMVMESAPRCREIFERFGDGLLRGVGMGVRVLMALGFSVWGLGFGRVFTGL